MTDYLGAKTMDDKLFLILVICKIIHIDFESYYKTICTFYEFEYNVYVHKIMIQLFNYYLAISNTN